MKIVIDLDDTIANSEAGKGYSNLIPNSEVVSKLREYREKGFKIAIHTARNMRTYNANMGKINANTLPVIIDWLNNNNVPYDEIYVGKPWCEDGGFYVDDKSIRPDEFVNLSLQEVYALIGTEAKQ